MYRDAFLDLGGGYDTFQMFCRGERLLNRGFSASWADWSHQGSENMIPTIQNHDPVL